MGDEIQECDAFRVFDKITEPDVRGIGVFHTTDLKNWQRYVDERLKPSPYIPTEILVQIETVKNLFLYSWFVYRFGIVAKNQMLNVMELALRKKFEIEKIPSPNGLRGKLEKALAEGWFDDSAFTHPSKPNGTEASAVIIAGIAHIRNDLNHGSTMLFDPLNLIDTSRNCLAITGALFQNKNPAKAEK